LDRSIPSEAGFSHFYKQEDNEIATDPE